MGAVILPKGKTTLSRALAGVRDSKQMTPLEREALAPRIKVTFKSGERVRIVDGPFNDFRGTVSEIDMERAKVRVMVEEALKNPIATMAPIGSHSGGAEGIASAASRTTIAMVPPMAIHLRVSNRRSSGSRPKEAKRLLAFLPMSTSKSQGVSSCIGISLLPWTVTGTASKTRSSRVESMFPSDRRSRGGLAGFLSTCCPVRRDAG